MKYIELSLPVAFRWTSHITMFVEFFLVNISGTRFLRMLSCFEPLLFNFNSRSHPKIKRNSFSSLFYLSVSGFRCLKLSCFTCNLHLRVCSVYRVEEGKKNFIVLINGISFVYVIYIYIYIQLTWWASFKNLTRYYPETERRVPVYVVFFNKKKSENKKLVLITKHTQVSFPISQNMNFFFRFVVPDLTLILYIYRLFWVMSSGWYTNTKTKSCLTEIKIVSLLFYDRIFIRGST